MATRLIVAGGTVLAAGLATVAFDRFVVGRAASEPVTGNLVFQPNQTISYETLEFTFEIQTNNLGFRGPLVNPHDDPDLRILGLGDSYVLGWGVNDEDTWLRVLEGALRGKGLDAECLNLGRLGGSEPEFLAVLQRALPTLRPDLVVLGLPQREQIPDTAPVPASERFRLGLQQWRFRLYPNIMERLHRRNGRRPPASKSIRKRGKAAEGLTVEQRDRLAALDERLPDAYDNGTLPPGLLFLLDRDPGTPLVTPNSLRPTPAAFDAEVANLTARLRPIKAACDRWGAGLLVVAYPIPKFCSREINANYERLGLEFDEVQLSTDVPDRIVTEACAALDVPSIVASGTFRAASQGLFFPLDGHLTPVGNRMLANQLIQHAEEWARVDGY